MRTFQIAVIVALLTVLVILLILALTSYRCFLDVLNGAIKRQCVFKPFYAGTPDTPTTRDVIPELGALEDAFIDIRTEMEEILKDRDKIPYMHDTYDNIFMYKGSGAKGKSFLTKAITRIIYGNDTEIFDRIGSPNWRTFNLIMFDQNVPGNADRCPKTVSLLRQVPGVQSALFSIIAPGTYIPPHSDPAKGVIRYHLALKVPKDREKCFINVNGRPYCWEEGKGVLFDDVYEHWVRNDTDEERVILFVDILRPLHGVAKFLQNLANFANHHHPGVKRAIHESTVVDASPHSSTTPLYSLQVKL